MLPDSFDAARDEAAMTSSPDDRPEASADLALQVEQLTAELDALRAESQDQTLRLQAELQNVQARARREAQRQREEGKADAVAPLFGVLDDVQRALDAARAADADASIVTGLDGVLANAEAALARLGVEPIAAVGHPFDAHQHEALAQVPAPDGTASGTVVQEYRRGYRTAERVLRPSQVVVAA